MRGSPKYPGLKRVARSIIMILQIYTPAPCILVKNVFSRHTPLPAVYKGPRDDMAIMTVGGAIDAAQAGLHFVA